VTDTLSLLDGLATTRAIRRYTDEPVTDEQLQQVLFAATRAPSGSNRQQFRFIVLRDGETAARAKALIGGAARAVWLQKRVADGYTTGSGVVADSPKSRMERTMQRYVDSFNDVPVLVLACLIRYRDANPYEGSSIYPACQNLLLGARAVGLGGVLTGFHHSVETELIELLGIPDGVALHATITLGHPEGSHGPVRRRPISELVYGDQWGMAPLWAVDPPDAKFTQAGPPRTS
jgi:nitroreductase